MTPEQRAEYVDSLPEDVVETMRKLALAFRRYRERVVFETMRSVLGKEAGKTLGDECLEQDNVSTFGVPDARSFYLSSHGGETWKPLVGGGELR